MSLLLLLLVLHRNLCFVLCLLRPRLHRLRLVPNDSKKKEKEKEKGIICFPFLGLLMYLLLV